VRSLLVVAVAGVLLTACGTVGSVRERNDGVACAEGKRLADVEVRLTPGVYNQERADLLFRIVRRLDEGDAVPVDSWSTSDDTVNGFADRPLSVASRRAVRNLVRGLPGVESVAFGVRPSAAAIPEGEC